MPPRKVKNKAMFCFSKHISLSPSPLWDSFEQGKYQELCTKIKNFVLDNGICLNFKIRNLHSQDNFISCPEFNAVLDEYERLEQVPISYNIRELDSMLSQLSNLYETYTQNRISNIPKF